MFNLRQNIKKNKSLLGLYESLFVKPVINLFGDSVGKRVLLSYSIYHFKHKLYTAHSNYQESWIIAEVFRGFGYQVDVVNNNRLTKLNLSKYDVIFGEGLPMFQALHSSVSALKIYYGTGSHPFHCTEQSFNRLIKYYRDGDCLALNSVRTSDYRWGLAASMSDFVICIGNAHTADTFFEQRCKNVFTLDPTFHYRTDALSIGHTKDFSRCRKSLLFFGSYGLLHKGLDLAIEAIRCLPDWTLHICGHMQNEAEFVASLELPKNVVVHGFIDVHSTNFKLIAKTCGFVILPSCSEGIATAVITAVGSGAMIPLVSKECGYDIQKGGFLIELNARDIERQLIELDKLDNSKIREIALNAQKSAIERYTVENYSSKIRRYLIDILQIEGS